MNNVEFFEKELKEDWDEKGFNGAPLFLMPSSASGFSMKKDLGYGYSKFLFHYHHDVGEMNYFNPDFDFIWKKIKAKLKQDRNYLKKIKSQYDRNFAKEKSYFEYVSSSNISKLSDDRLLELFKIAVKIQTESCASAHLLDAISFRADGEFIDLLTKKVGRKTAQMTAPILSAPTELSFVGEEENDLFKIKQVKEDAKRKKLLSAHTEKYHWLLNSYVGAVKLNEKYFQEKMKEISAFKSSEQIIKEKDSLIKKLSLSKELINLIKLIDFSTVWQDQRKANILKSISALHLVADAVSKKTKVPFINICYLTLLEVYNLQDLSKIKNLSESLAERRNGVYILQMEKGEVILSGCDYSKIKKLKESNKLSSGNLKGFVASRGLARGKARICLNLASIKKFKKNEILVASMTRPEYLPAMKLASAIVTDEGGITCHAAIVSRELGIPCIIGTKIATKVLEDGDLVEVDANKGIVRKIK